uniref:Uncharacterized protein n=1 Tax=Cacopsylla melanoneura TaxID=428564 RepID=A0A8D8Q010_9HEMI
MNFIPILLCTAFTLTSTSLTSSNRTATKHKFGHLVDQVCNFLQPKTSTNNFVKKVLHVGDYTTEISLELSDDNRKILVETYQNITRCGYAAKRPMNLCLDQLTTNGSSISEKMVCSMLPEVTKYLEVRTMAEVTEDLAASSNDLYNDQT